MSKDNGFSRDWEWNNKEPDKFLSKNQLRKKRRPPRKNQRDSRAAVISHFNLPGNVTNKSIALEVCKLTGWKFKDYKTSHKKIIQKFASYLAQGKDFTRKQGSNDFYRSREWRELRYEALIRCGRRCMCCGAQPKDGIILHVDHVKPRSKYPHLELDINNLQVLCEDCNLGKSNIYEHDFREE